GALAATASAGLRCSSVDAAGETRERQRLQPDGAGSAERCEEQAFAAEERGLYSADKLDVVIDTRLESHDAAGVHAQAFAGSQGAFVDRAASVEKGPAIALQPLHDEAL